MSPDPLERSQYSRGELAAAADSAESLEELSGLLRSLRRRHARSRRDTPLTYRELAAHTGWSQAAIAEYFTARTLPPTDRLDALAKVLDATPAEQHALAGARDRVEEHQRRAKARHPADGLAAEQEPTVPDPGPRSAAPRQLPPDTALFTGRGEQLAVLLSLDRHDPAGSPGTVVISAIDGMGGVGKTALAIHAGHRLAARFPDGQLFIDLCGFTRDTPPRAPADALAALLSCLGVPPQQIPAEPEARAALYRDRLAGTRTLIVLDNAADEAQVRPLLPAVDTCLVLVTSRRRLKALDDAVPLPLDVLAPHEAVGLLRTAARLTAGPADEPLLERAAELCGHLPLALLIAGALLRTGGRAWNLPLLIDRLTRRPGDELAGYTDETRSLQAVFDLSYRRLPADLRVLFRRVGLLPGPDIDAYAAAALLQVGPHQAARLLERLADHSLLTAAAPGRYRPHDLIRAHARTLGATVEPAAERDAALDRLLHYYAHTAQTAAQLIARLPRPAPDGPAPAHAPELHRPEAARAWLRAEHPNLDAAFTHADTHHIDRHVIALAAGMAEIMSADGPWLRALETDRAAADAALRQGRPAARANALIDLGRVRYLTGDLQAAADAQTEALEIHRRLGDLLGEAVALNHLGLVRSLAGALPAAVDPLAQALEIYRRLGHRHGEAAVLTRLGQVWAGSGDLPAAADAHNQALDIYRSLGDRLGEANALTGLGLVWILTGDLPAAADAQMRALEIYRRLGDRLGEANVLTRLGMVRYQTGDFPEAADAHSRALEIHRHLGHHLGEAGALTNLGRARHRIGDLPAAADAHSRALEIYRRLGNRSNEAWALNPYAATVFALGDRPRALALYRQALAMNRELHKPDDEAVSLEGIAEHHLATGDTAQGTAHLRQAFEIYRHLGMRADIERLQTRLTELAPK